MIRTRAKGCVDIMHLAVPLLWNVVCQAKWPRLDDVEVSDGLMKWLASTAVEGMKVQCLGYTCILFFFIFLLIFSGCSTR
jgi:hypothetical protein